VFVKGFVSDKSPILRAVVDLGSNITDVMD
jgi:hypothetical protein